MRLDHVSVTKVDRQIFVRLKSLVIPQHTTMRTLTQQVAAWAPGVRTLTRCMVGLDRQVAA